MAFPTHPRRVSMPALVFLLLASSGVSMLHAASPCAALTENVLTSVGCPAACGSFPCILYSPSQKRSCESLPIGQRVASGPCHRDQNYMFHGEKEPCEMTFQCMDKLVDDQGRWKLALIGNTQANQIVTAPVTKIASLAYPDNITSIEILGTVAKSVKALVQNIQLDASFFQTPNSMEYLYLTGVNMSQLADTAPVSKAVKNLGYIHANLHTLPSTDLQDLTLETVYFSNNYLTSFPSDNTSAVVQSLQTTALLSLEYNLLKDFTTYLPKLEILNLTGNPLGRIPDVIYEMPTLQALSMVACSLANVHLTVAQFEFLDQLQIFEATMTLTGCRDGFKPMFFTRVPLQVCVQTTTQLASPTP